MIFKQPTKSKLFSTKTIIVQNHAASEVNNEEVTSLKLDVIRAPKSSYGDKRVNIVYRCMAQALLALREIRKIYKNYRIGYCKLS